MPPSRRANAAPPSWRHFCGGQRGATLVATSASQRARALQAASIGRIDVDAERLANLTYDEVCKAYIRFFAVRTLLAAATRATSGITANVLRGSVGLRGSVPPYANTALAAAQSGMPYNILDSGKHGPRSGWTRGCATHVCLA
eukprot:1253397-Pleurochrysis_carterae.AAC.1